MRYPMIAQPESNREPQSITLPQQAVKSPPELTDAFESIILGPVSGRLSMQYHLHASALFFLRKLSSLRFELRIFSIIRGNRLCWFPRCAQ